jgi:hypothetical protein
MKPADALRLLKFWHACPDRIRVAIENRSFCQACPAKCDRLYKGTWWKPTCADHAGNAILADFRQAGKQLARQAEKYGLNGLEFGKASYRMHLALVIAVEKCGGNAGKFSSLLDTYATRHGHHPFWTQEVLRLRLRLEAETPEAKRMPGPKRERTAPLPCQMKILDLYLDTLAKEPRLKRKTLREIYGVIYSPQRMEMRKQKKPPAPDTWLKYIREGGRLHYKGMVSRAT